MRITTVSKPHKKALVRVANPPLALRIPAHTGGVRPGAGTSRARAVAQHTKRANLASRTSHCISVSRARRLRTKDPAAARRLVKCPALVRSSIAVRNHALANSLIVRTLTPASPRTPARNPRAARNHPAAMGPNNSMGPPLHPGSQGTAPPGPETHPDPMSLSTAASHQLAQTRPRSRRARQSRS
jgi:hypothetical protein